MITTVDPTTPAYARDYAAGWNVSERASEGALERADARNVSHAWYDGYFDYAAGRPKWTFRTWRVNGCDSGCGYVCDGPHRDPEHLALGATTASVVASPQPTKASTAMTATTPDHADYPHQPGTLYDCPACEPMDADEPE